MAKDRITKNYTTGKGALTGFVCLFKPSTKFNKQGVYTANILLDKEEGENLQKLAKEVAKEQFKAYGKGKKISELTCIKPYTTVNDDGEEVPDKEERYVLKTNTKAWIEDDKPTKKILVVDSKKQPVKNLSVGAGTIARLFVTLEGYTTPKETNVTAVLKAVQIVKPVEIFGISLEDTGFEEEGFIYEKDEEELIEVSESPEDSEEDF